MNIGNIGKSCCGCGACAQVCPKGCISLEADAEGFAFPKVDASQCVDCGLCLARCPVAAPPEGHAPSAAYAARLNDDAALSESSSGGVFTALAKDTLAAGGVVFGAVLHSESRRVELVAAETEAATLPMRGSKYVQSDAGAAYRAVDEALRAGRRVLFTGCPCQVAGLRAYLRREDSNLVLADIVCHGVPSPLLFATYVRALEEEVGARLTAYRFRTKTHGWGMECAYEAGGKTRERRTIFDPYGHCFLKGQIYRESCYQCPFARPERQGDLTLGDYWGVLQEHPSFYTERGVSAVLVNTEKGAAVWERLAPRLAQIESSFERVSRHNLNLLRPTPRPAERDHIYEGLGTLAPREYVRKRLRVRNDAKTLVKSLLPWRLKRLYQRIAGDDR